MYISACCTMKMITKTRQLLERDSLQMIVGLGMENMNKEDYRLYLIMFLLEAQFKKFMHRWGL